MSRYNGDHFVGQLYAYSTTRTHSTEGEILRGSRGGGRGAKRERSMNATPSMLRLNVGRAAVITRVGGVLEPVRESGPEGVLNGDWAMD